MAARSKSHSAHNTRGRSETTSPDPDRENYYQLLGVSYSATATEITRSYRESMKRFHPDRVRPEYRAAAENLCKDLNLAYRTLSNPTDRLAYDRSIRATEVQDQIMNRYVGGFTGANAKSQDPYATKLKRTITSAERKDHRRSERSAVISLISIFLVLALGAIGLILIGGLVSFVFRQFF